MKVKTKGQTYQGWTNRLLFGQLCLTVICWAGKGSLGCTAPVEGCVAGQVAVAESRGGDILGGQDGCPLGRKGNRTVVNLVVRHSWVGEVALQ